MDFSGNSIIPLVIFLLGSIAVIATAFSVAHYLREIKALEAFAAYMDGRENEIVRLIYRDSKTLYTEAGVRTGFLKDLLEEIEAGFLARRLPPLSDLRAMAYSRDRAYFPNRLINFVASICLILGILGTLFALQLLLGKAGFADLLSSNATISAADLQSRVIQVYSGFNGAFRASICGILATVSIMALRGWPNSYRLELFRRLDAFATKRLFRLFYSTALEDTFREGFASLQTELKKTSGMQRRVVAIVRRQNRIINADYKDFSGIVKQLMEMTRALSNVGPEMAEAATQSKKAVQAFQRSFGADNPIHNTLQEWVAIGKRLDVATQRWTSWIEQRSSEWIALVKHSEDVRSALEESAKFIAGSSEKMTETSLALREQISQWPTQMSKLREANSKDFQLVSSEIKAFGTAINDQSKPLIEALGKLAQSELEAGKGSSEVAIGLKELQESVQGFSNLMRNAFRSEAENHLSHLSAMTARSNEAIAQSIRNVELYVNSFDRTLADSLSQFSILQRGLDNNVDLLGSIRTVEAAIAKHLSRIVTLIENPSLREGDQDGSAHPPVLHVETAMSDDIEYGDPDGSAHHEPPPLDRCEAQTGAFISRDAAPPNA